MPEKKNRATIENQLEWSFIHKTIRENLCSSLFQILHNNLIPPSALQTDAVYLIYFTNTAPLQHDDHVPTKKTF